VPEKKAKGFGYAEKDQIFEIKKNAEPAKGDDKQIILNIAESSGKKILLRQKVATVKFTGNFFIDTYTKANQFLIEHSSISIRDKAVFFRLLSTMLNAGLPLIRSLRTLGFQSEKSPKLARLLFEMAGGIEGGKSLSQVMTEYPDVFSDAQIGVIRSGEASGQLNKVLRSLAEELEKTASINSKIKGALIYPVVILSLLVVAIFLMMILVVPQLTTLFTETGNKLPVPTRVLIGLSDFSVKYWPFMLLAIFMMIMGFSYYRKTRTGRYMLDYLKLKLPIFGVVIQKGVLSKFSRGFANLMGSGVPITRSIEIIAHAVGNEVYKRRLILTAEDMKKGIPMAENLSESPLFPKMLVNMIEVGEQTAQLENVMLKVASFYDEEVDTVVASLSKIMEPLILVVIGVTVGGLVAAIMLPIMQLTNVAGAM
jgi:type IV pilus assembly protein PilC